MIRWRGRESTCERQVANARDSFVDLTPASEIPAQIVKSDWSAVLRGQEIPLIGEIRHGYEDPCE